VELFNAANKGKIIITEDDEGVRIYRRMPAEYLVKKGVKNSEFPFKRIVMCPGCKRPLYGSSSRGRHGKYFPAYHCNQRDGHYFRKPKKEFDHTIEEFVKHLNISEEYINELMEYVGEAFDKQQMEIHKDSITLDARLNQLRDQIRINVDKIKMVSSETTIKYLEEDITKLETEIAELTLERQRPKKSKSLSIWRK
jgi:polyhydroxyalkanoate synthesis regulator phasin